MRVGTGIRCEHRHLDLLPQRNGGHSELHPAEHFGAEDPGAAELAAMVTGFDVANESLATPQRQRRCACNPLPGDAIQNRACRTAVVCAEDYYRGGRHLEPRARIRPQCVRFAPGHAEHCGKVRAVESMPVNQIQHFALTIGQPVQGSLPDLQRLPPEHGGVGVRDVDFPRVGVRGGDVCRAGVGGGGVRRAGSVAASVVPGSGVAVSVVPGSGVAVSVVPGVRPGGRGAAVRRYRAAPRRPGEERPSPSRAAANSGTVCARWNRAILGSGQGPVPGRSVRRL